VEHTDWHEIEVLTPGSGIMVNLDHEQVVSKARIRPPLARGTVALGLVPGTPPSGRWSGRTRIEFANVSITSAP